MNGQCEGSGVGFLSKLLHTDLYSLHPCWYWYHYARLSSWEQGLRLGRWEVTGPAALMRHDTGSRLAEHPAEFNQSRTFPVGALDQRSLPANQNTWAWRSPPICDALAAEQVGAASGSDSMRYIILEILIIHTYQNIQTTNYLKKNKNKQTFADLNMI